MATWLSGNFRKFPFLPFFYIFLCLRFTFRGGIKRALGD